MIVRDPSGASAQSYDLIVIGGGIYGVCIALEATRAGLRPLLLERDDFGGATSWNSLRIIHGGLRYLQTLDLRRYRESVQERRWFLREFPDLVHPLPCLMPLYNEGGKRPWMLRAALRLNDCLSRRRNDGVASNRHLANGRMLSATESRLHFRLVRLAGLCGSALWHDAVMRSPQRVLMEILRRAISDGAIALNYVEAVSLVHCRGDVAGVAAVDRVAREMTEFHAPIVVNAAGPWCRELARGMNGGRDDTGLFRPSLAYNLLLDRPPLSKCAVAVSSGRTGGRVYFLHATAGGVLAGTEHVPVREWNGTCPQPTPERIERTLSELNAAVPGWGLSPRDVLRVYCGLLPARRDETEALATRAVICDHGQCGGPRGLHSVSGVKFTTARLVAEQVISRIAVSRARGNQSPPDSGRETTAHDCLNLISPEQLLYGEDRQLHSRLVRLIRDESVVTLEDLLLRRTSWLDDPTIEERVRDRVCSLLDLDLPSQSEVRVRQQAADVGNSTDGLKSRLCHQLPTFAKQ